MKTSESLNPTPDTTPEFPAGTIFRNGDQLDLQGKTSEAVNERARALMDAAMHAESTKDFHDKQPDVAPVQPEKLLAKHELIGENNRIVTITRRNELDLAA